MLGSYISLIRTIAGSRCATWPVNVFVVIGDRDPGRLEEPIDVAIDGDGDIYVTDPEAKQVSIYTASGQYKSSITTTDIPQQDWYPRYVAVDGNRQIYISDWSNHCVHVLKDGRHIQQIGSQGDREGYFNWPAGIALSRDGGLIVCDNGNHRIQGFDDLEWLNHRYCVACGVSPHYIFWLNKTSWHMIGNE